MVQSSSGMLVTYDSLEDARQTVIAESREEINKKGK